MKRKEQLSREGTRRKKISKALVGPDQPINKQINRQTDGQIQQVLAMGNCFSSQRSSLSGGGGGVKHDPLGGPVLHPAENVHLAHAGHQGRRGRSIAELFSVHQVPFFS